MATLIATSLGQLRTYLKTAAGTGELVMLQGGTYTLLDSEIDGWTELVVPAGVHLAMQGQVTVILKNPTRGFLVVGSGPAERGDGAFLDLKNLRVVLDLGAGVLRRPNFSWVNTNSELATWVGQWNAAHPTLSALTVDTNFKKTWEAIFTNSPVMPLGNSTATNRNSVVTVLDSHNVTILGGYAENLNCGVALVGESASNRLNSRNILIDGFEANLCDTGILLAHQDNARVNGFYCHDGTATQQGEPHALYATGEPTADELSRAFLLTNTRLERMYNGEPIKLKTSKGAVIDNAQLIDCSAFLIMGTSDAVVSNVTMANQRILYRLPGNRLGGSGNNAFRLTNAGSLQVSNYRIVQQPTPIDYGSDSIGATLH